MYVCVCACVCMRTREYAARVLESPGALTSPIREACLHVVLRVASFPADTGIVQTTLSPRVFNETARGNEP